MQDFEDDVLALIRTMVGAYERAQGRKILRDRIRRGRAAAASSDFEDALARLIRRQTAGRPDVEIWIDTPISLPVRGAERKRIIYPDISLVRACGRSRELIGIVEAKIDLGFLSPEWADDLRRTVERLKEAGDAAAGDEGLSVSRKLRAACVVLSARNHGDKAPRLKEELSEVFILLSKDCPHPNAHVKGGVLTSAEYIKQARGDRANKKEWAGLRKFIRSVVK